MCMSQLQSAKTGLRREYIDTGININLIKYLLTVSDRHTKSSCFDPCTLMEPDSVFSVHLCNNRKPLKIFSRCSCTVHFEYLEVEQN